MTPGFVQDDAEAHFRLGYRLAAGLGCAADEAEARSLPLLRPRTEAGPIRSSRERDAACPISTG